MTGFKYVLLLFLSLGVFEVSTFYALGDDDGPITQEFVARPSDPNSPIESIAVRAIEITDPDAISDGDGIIEGHGPIDMTTIVRPDEITAENPLFSAKANELASRVHAKASQSVTVPTHAFSEWFLKSGFRITVILLEIAFVSKLKYTELVYSPEHVSHAPALTAALLIAATIGIVDWNIPHIARFIQVPSSPVKRLFEYISQTANTPELRKRVEYRLLKSFEFLKNTAINVALLSAVKLILYSTIKADGTIGDRILDALIAAADADLLSKVNFAGTAVAATIVSFPMTQVILAYKDRLLKEAQGNRRKSLKAINMLTLAMSSALTARVALFCSKIVAVSFGMPNLNHASNLLLGGMFAWSAWKLYDNKRKAAVCARAVRPSAQ